MFMSRKDILVSEVETATRNLKTNQASGIEEIINEMINASGESPHDLMQKGIFTRQ
jgi:hypothetical protein